MPNIDKIQSKALRDLIKEKLGAGVDLTVAQVTGINTVLLDQNANVDLLRAKLKEVVTVDDVSTTFLDDVLGSASILVFNELKKVFSEKGLKDLGPLYSFMLSERGFYYLKRKEFPLDDIQGLRDRIFQKSIDKSSLGELLLRVNFLLEDSRKYVQEKVVEGYLRHDQKIVNILLEGGDDYREYVEALKVFAPNSDVSRLTDADIVDIDATRAHAALLRGDITGYSRMRRSQETISHILSSDFLKKRNYLSLFLINHCFLPDVFSYVKRLVDERGELQPMNPTMDSTMDPTMYPIIIGGILEQLIQQNILYNHQMILEIGRRTNLLVGASLPLSELHQCFLGLVDKCEVSVELLEQYQEKVRLLRNEFEFGDDEDLWNYMLEETSHLDKDRQDKKTGRARGVLGKAIDTLFHKTRDSATDVTVVTIPVCGKAGVIKGDTLVALFDKKYCTYDPSDDSISDRPEVLFDKDFSLVRAGKKVLGFSVNTKEDKPKTIAYDAGKNEYTLTIEGDDIGSLGYMTGLIALGLKHRELNVHGIDPPKLKEEVSRQLEKAGIEVFDFPQPHPARRMRAN